LIGKRLGATHVYVSPHTAPSTSLWVCRSAVLGLLNLASVEPVRKELREGKGFQHVAWLMQSVTPNTQEPEVLLEVCLRVRTASHSLRLRPVPAAASHV